MHGDGFEVDAEQLAARASGFEPLVERLGTIHRNLVEALAVDGGCWGTDAVGSSFAAVHTTAADDTVTRLALLADRLGGVGTRLSDSAATYAATDQSAVAHLKVAEQ